MSSARAYRGGVSPASQAVCSARVFMKGAAGDCGKVLHEARYLGQVAGPGVVPLHSSESAPTPLSESDGHCDDRDGHCDDCDGDGVRLLLEAAACSLADVLHERGPLPEAEVRGVAVAAAGTLIRVHRAGIVHGDVKPANLLLSDDGLLWLADFDAAAPSDGRTLTRFSPNRVPSNAHAAPETDILGLAMTLIELASGALVDPEVVWNADDLSRLGCPPRLSADIACVLGALGEASARSVEALFKSHGLIQLPAPASGNRMCDSTPTVDFTPWIPQSAG